MAWLRNTILRPARRAVAAFPALALAIAALGYGLSAPPARAQIGSARYSSLVMEAATGKIVSGVNLDEPRYPASLTKLMTLYMTFEALRDRRVSLNQLVPVSPAAAGMSPTKLGLTPGTLLTVEQAIMGLVTKSANDAAAALAELLGGGDERRFAQMMTLRARALGMTGTVFRNASGLPDPDQVSTARDLALLARHLLLDFPQQYHYFSVQSFTFHGHVIPNHDHMLQSYPGADGLKTGYVNASGFNLVTSAVRGDVRLIGVVLGAAHPAERDRHMATLLDAGFEQFNVPVSVARAPAAGRAGGLIYASLAPPAPLLPLRDVPVEAPRQAARWSVSLGVYASGLAAHRAAAFARGVADDGDVKVEPMARRRRPAYRALLVDLTAVEAHGVCAEMARRRRACVPTHDGSGGDVASR